MTRRSPFRHASVLNLKTRIEFSTHTSYKAARAATLSLSVV